jgi:hypothetical protein
VTSSTWAPQGLPTELHILLKLSSYEKDITGAIGKDVTEILGLLLIGASFFLVESQTFLNSEFLNWK